MSTLTTAQIKVGDVLIREKDHLGRPDDRLTVTEVWKQGGRLFRLKEYFSQSLQSPKTLSAQNYRIVERNGERIGEFFVKYW